MKEIPQTDHATFFPSPSSASLSSSWKQKSTIPEEKDPGYMSSPPVSTTEGFICGGIAACIAVGLFRTSSSFSKLTS